MINILTDSTADIPKDLLSKYHIDVIPMYVQLNGRMYYDGANITAEELFEWVKATGSIQRHLRHLQRILKNSLTGKTRAYTLGCPDNYRPQFLKSNIIEMN